MTDLFVTDGSRNYLTAIDTAMDTLPPKAKRITIVLEMTPDGLVHDVTTTDTSVDGEPEYLMKTPPVSCTNTTGIRGVSKVKNGYRADITRGGKQTNLGTYDSLQDAVEARLVAQWGLD
jgi:hypothetical protein